MKKRPGLALKKTSCKVILPFTKLCVYRIVRQDIVGIKKPFRVLGMVLYPN